MKTFMILSFVVVCFLLACSKNINKPIKSYEKRHVTSVNRYRSDEIIVMYKSTPTPAAANLIKTAIEKNYKIGPIQVKKCKCNEYVELWQAANIHKMLAADSLDAPTVSPKGSQGAAEDGLAYYSLNFLSKNPLDSPMDLTNLRDSVKQLQFSGKGKDTITVAVLDTGIDTTYLVSPNFLWKNTHEKTNEEDDDGNCYVDDTHGWNFVGDNSNIIEDNRNLHGTLVTQYIINEFALSPNNFVQIMSLKTHDEDGYGALFSSICAMHYAMNKGANIINASWGFYHYKDGRPHPYLDQLIMKTMRNNGILFIAAAGNKDQEVDKLARKAYREKYGLDIPDEMLRNLEYHSFYPACLSREGKNVITVTTTDGTRVSPTQNYSEKYVDIGVMRDVNDQTAMKFLTPFAGPTALISGSSFASAIACGKIGAHFPKDMYGEGLNKDAVFEKLRSITPAAGMSLITYEPVLETHLIRNGKKTYPK